MQLNALAMSGIEPTTPRAELAILDISRIGRDRGTQGRVGSNRPLSMNMLI